MAGTIPVPVILDPDDSGVAAQSFLQPIAAPSILGLYGFAGATFMVAAHMAGWFGGGRTDAARLRAQTNPGVGEPGVVRQ